MGLNCYLIICDSSKVRLSVYLQIYQGDIDYKKMLNKNHLSDLILIIGVFVSALLLVPAVLAQTDFSQYTYGDINSINYFLNGTMPTFRRNLPISPDDPLYNAIPDDSPIRYQYGYAFQNVNDYYFYNRVAQRWEGNAPLMDSGVLIGGNAKSKHDAMELDSNFNDFNSVLPYASVFIDTKKLSYDEGTIIYEFFSDDFNFNCSEETIPNNVFINGDNVKITNYKEKFPDLAYPRKRSIEYPVNWMGIVYTGGIQKTVPDGDGGYIETVVRNEDSSGDSKLFTIRYVDAAQDKNGNYYDLVLTFTQITFVAEAEVNGALAILEANRIYLAPILYEDGHYTITIDDPSNKVDVHDFDGIRVGARYEFDYIVEDQNGNPAEGLILYSMNDLDNASMSTMLQTDSNWGANDLGNDFKWAEGFGIIDGAASFAVLPYFNHEIRDVYRRPINNRNGDTSLLRISRMPGITPDGTANGLYFTTAITAVSGSGARNDADTQDTGISVLMQTKGSLIAAISTGRRGDVNITFFDNNNANKIEQSSIGKGQVYSMDYSFQNEGELVKNTDFIKVVGTGVTSTHYIQPEEGYHIFRIRIDGRVIPYNDLKWTSRPQNIETAGYNILDEYGRIVEKTNYLFTKDKDGTVSFSFNNIHDNHEVAVEFVHSGLISVIRSMDIGTISAVFLIAAFALMIIVCTTYWMLKGRKKNQDMY